MPYNSKPQEGMHDLYINATDALGNLLLEEICQQQNQTFRYYLTPVKDKTDAQILSGESHSIRYTYEGRCWEANGKRIIAEIKTINWSYEQINNRCLIEIYKRNNIIEEAILKGAKPVYINIDATGEVAFFDCVNTRADFGNYPRQKKHGIFTNETTTEPAYKFYLEDSFLRIKLPERLEYYQEKAKLFMFEQTGNKDYLKLELKNKRKN